MDEPVTVHVIDCGRQLQSIAGGFWALFLGAAELDSPFYAAPKRENPANMLVDGGPDLTFSIKALQGLTRRADRPAWEDTAGRCLEALEPLREASGSAPRGGWRRCKALPFGTG